MGPKIGDKVGFIQLPTRPAARGGRSPGAKPAGGAEEPPKVVREVRGDQRDRRDMRGGPARGFQPGRPGARPGGPSPSPATGQKFAQPTSGELISLKPPIIVRELAEKLNRKPYQLIADLIELKVMASVNQAIDEETAKQLCAKYGFRFEVEKRERGAGVVHTHIKKVEIKQDDKPEDLVTRAPVVTIMGHVDHGKTTLLDVIRKAHVAESEAGGITQHIGAYTIAVPHPDRKGEMQQITFLDTPGHAAFSAMRARGANVTDIVILVVAANDGVMPQTVEAINHAKAAKVPILVAVNKCDHPAANPMRARQQLQEKGLVPDDWGGETIFVDVSALTRQGVDKLLEMIVLQADILELKANPNRKAVGNVIESGLSAGGPTASVLVRTGTLHVGDTILCGPFWGKVRALINDEGQRLKEAGPSVAVKVLGLSGVPEAGLEFNVVQDDKTARLLVTE
ncbi:MAG TPA: translation initiation factor IF-2, partial [Verrucomicrobiae bacterium]|nr:translation initiation factor IF-2 [Verrucomicrobiae bacterium]